MKNYDWLHQVCMIKEEAWYLEKVIRIDQVENHEFYEDTFTQYKAFVNPRQIRGIQYAYDYNDTNDITWMDLLNRLKRFDRIRSSLTDYSSLVSHVHKYHKGWFSGRKTEGLPS